MTSPVHNVVCQFGASLIPSCTLSLPSPRSHWLWVVFIRQHLKSREQLLYLLHTDIIVHKMNHPYIWWNGSIYTYWEHNYTDLCFSWEFLPSDLSLGVLSSGSWIRVAEGSDIGRSPIFGPQQLCSAPCIYIYPVGENRFFSKGRDARATKWKYMSHWDLYSELSHCTFAISYCQNTSQRWLALFFERI